MSLECVQLQFLPVISAYIMSFIVCSHSKTANGTVNCARVASGRQEHHLHPEAAGDFDTFPASVHAGRHAKAGEAAEAL